MGQRRRRSASVQLRELLGGVYPTLPADAQALLTLIDWWGRHVPTRLANHVCPVRFADGVLHVHVRSAAWADEFSYARDLLTAEIRQFLPQVGLKQIRAMIGEVPERRPPEALLQDVEGRDTQRDAVDLAAVPETLARELAHIADDDLRLLVQRAAFAQSRRKIKASSPGSR